MVLGSLPEAITSYQFELLIQGGIFSSKSQGSIFLKDPVRPVVFFLLTCDFQLILLFLGISLHNNNNKCSLASLAGNKRCWSLTLNYQGGEHHRD